MQQVRPVNMKVMFARRGPVADTVVHCLHRASSSIDAALYRFTLPRLCRELEAAAGQGRRVRLLVDGNKYHESPVTQELLSRLPFPFRLAYGRRGQGSKMHHKFVLVDREILLTGSYNWTPESEEENYENLVIIEDGPTVEAYSQEFEALWMESEASEVLIP